MKSVNEDWQVTSDQQGGKNPTVATALSFLLFGGGGQFYNGQAGKGAVFVVIFFLLYFLAGPACIVMSFIGAFDAYNVAVGRVDDLLVEKKSEILTTTLSVVDFTSQIEKLHTLTKSGILTDREFCERKRQVIELLSTKHPLESVEDFLAGLIKLKNNEALSQEEIQIIKGYLM